MAGKGKRGAVGKYTPELAEDICNAIALHGSDESGWKGRISKETYYVWLREKPDFSDLIEQAKTEYRHNLPEVDHRQARRAFVGYLYGTMERVVVKTEKGYTKASGHYEKEVIHRIPTGIPKWAIERVLGSQMSEFEALQKLIEAGWIPKEVLNIAIAEFDKFKAILREVFAGILPAIDPGAKPGLTDETTAIIRSRILGIESASTIALSAEMDSGSESDQDLRKESADRDLVG